MAELFSYDGRLAKTTLGLVTRPAALTKGYLEGKRASQLSPIRLFISVLLAVIVVGWATGGAQFGAGIRQGWQSASTSSRSADASASAARTTAVQQAQASPTEEKVRRVGGPARQWLREQGRRASENPEIFWQAVEKWSERTAFMMLPIAVALLYLLFIGRPEFYLFDHTIFALHSLSFQGLLLTVAFIIDSLGGWADWLVMALLLTLAPTHLFLHMRGVYATTWPGTLIRMLILGIGSVLGFAVLTLALVLIGLNSV